MRPARVFEWGTAALLVFFLGAVGAVYLTRDLTWLSWSGNALIVWVLVWVVFRRAQFIRERRRHVDLGAGEGIRSVLPRNAVWSIMGAVGVFAAVVFGARYLPGTRLDTTFWALLMIFWLGTLVWWLWTAYVEFRRERRLTAGVLRAVLGLFLLSTAPYLIRTLFGKLH